MKPGRNDPCPCGSGKKYKHCCLAAEQADTGALGELIWRRLRRLKDEDDFAATMLRFIGSAYGPQAVEEGWDEFTLWDDVPFDPGSPHVPVFMPWLFSQWVPDPQEDTTVADTRLHGVPPAQALLERRGHALDPLLREYLGSCLDAPLSFFEVLSARPGRGLELRDVFTAEVHAVLERSASHSLQAGDLVFGQVAAAQGVSLLEASGPVVIPPIHKIEVIELRQAMEKGSNAAPGERLREYDAELRELYFDLTERLLHPPPPELQNTDGEKLVLERLVFDVESAQTAFDALKSLDFEAGDDGDYELERAPDGHLVRAEIVWKKPGNAKNRGWNNTVLGHLVIENRRLTAEVNSHERGEALRRIVAERLGDRARYRVAEVQSAERLIEDAPAGHAARESEEDRALRDSPEIKAALTEYLARHYEQWVDEKIPALGDRTPVEAMREADGPEKVEALVRDAERTSRRMNPPVDEAIFRRLRARLGLPPAARGERI